jgi:hypothetical protein
LGSTENKAVNQQEAIFFRDQFRDARALALQDAERFQDVLFVLERFGSFLTGKIQTLGRYEKLIVEFAKRSPLADGVAEASAWHTPFSALIEYVRESRNDALHQGAFARHLTTHVVKLALVLGLKQAYPLGFLALPAPLVRGRTVPAAPGVV